MMCGWIGTQKDMVFDSEAVKFIYQLEDVFQVGCPTTCPNCGFWQDLFDYKEIKNVSGQNVPVVNWRIQNQERQKPKTRRE